jgi:hypothetical protein
MAKPTPPRRSVARGRKTNRIGIVNYHGDAPEEFGAHALEQIRKHYDEEMGGVDSFVTGVGYLIRDMLYLLADHDSAMAKLEKDHPAQGYPSRVSSYDDAIRELQDELQHRSSDHSGYLGHDR